LLESWSSTKTVFNTYEEEINGEPKTFYYGDSLAAYTFERVVLDLQGFGVGST